MQTLLARAPGFFKIWTRARWVLKIFFFKYGYTNTNNGTARPRARWGTATLRSIVPANMAITLEWINLDT